MLNGAAAALHRAAADMRHVGAGISGEQLGGLKGIPKEEAPPRRGFMDRLRSLRSKW